MFDDARYGVVVVTPRANARNITARRKSAGRIDVSVPRGIGVDEAMSAVRRLLERMGDAPLPALSYSIGQIIECDGIRFRIAASESLRSSVKVHYADGEAVVAVGQGVDMLSSGAVEAISGMMCRVASSLAARILLPRASRIASELGAYPSGWRIGRGKRTLGTCSSSGVITLSYMLVFLPLELRDYIVCHELAHLSEMNHSPAFHALCNSYCGGRERVLRASVNSYKWPVLR